MNTIYEALLRLLNNPAVRRFVQELSAALLGLLIEFVETLINRRRSGGPTLTAA